MKNNSIYKSDTGRSLIINHYDNLLKAWPVAKENILVNTSFGKTFVIASGRGDTPLILLHGSSTNSAMWMGDITKLSQNHRVYAVDIIGEPGKSAEDRPELTGSHYAKWLDEVLAGLNIDQAIFVGNSLGGWMALKYATDQPKRVKKLVLLATSGITPAKTSFLIKSISLILMGQKGIDRLNKLVYGQDTIPEEALEFSKLIMKYYRPRLGSLPVFSDQELSQLTMPTLYIGGEKDSLLPSKKIAKRIKRLLPNSQTVVLENTGHVLIDVVDQVMLFLD